MGFRFLAITWMGLFSLANLAWGMSPEPKLPENLWMKTPQLSIASRYLIGVLGGRLWLKEPDGHFSDWIQFRPNGLPIGLGPLGFAAPKSISEISADGDRLAAASNHGFLYLADLTSFRWRAEWGRRFHQHRLVLPADGAGPWAISHLPALSEVLQTTRRDRFGRKARVEEEATTVYVVSKRPDGSTRILYTDANQDAGFNRAICSPEQGRMKVRVLSASGSTLFVMDREGRMYTRFADFVSLGEDVDATYTYQVPDDRRSIGVALPPEDWRKQPSLPLNQMTGVITIVTTGPHAEDRELRVEGVNEDGLDGVYRKALLADHWDFQPVAREEGRPRPPLLSTLPPEFPSDEGPDRGISLEGTAELRGWDEPLSVRVTDFQMDCPMANFILRLSDRVEVRGRLHWRQIERADKYSVSESDPWTARAVLEFPNEIRHTGKWEHLRLFRTTLQSQRWFEVPLTFDPRSGALSLGEAGSFLGTLSHR